MLNGLKIDYVNSSNVSKLMKKALNLGVSLALVTSSPSIALAKNNFSSVNSDNSSISQNHSIRQASKKGNSSNSRLENSLTLYDVCEDDDLSYLNYFTDLESLTINGSEMGSGIKSLPNLRELTINTFEVDYRDLEFLSHCNHDVDLTISSFTQINVDLLESYSNIRNLTIYVSDKSNIDFQKLSFLDHLTIIGQEYDVPVHFSSEDYEYLTKSGVSITIEDSDGNDMYDRFMKIDSDLYDIVDSLNISEDASLEEKMDQVLIYVLENCEYESNVSGSDPIQLSPFYQNGYLSSFFNSDTQICGNYAAITKALTHRLGLESYLIESYAHAWNLIEIDGEYYFVDPTFLDTSTIVIGYQEEEKSSLEVLQDGSPREKSKLCWYMVDYDDYISYREEHDYYQNIHDPRNVPYFLLIENDNSNSNQVNVSLSNSGYNTSVNRNSLFGIFSCFGILKPVLGRKKDYEACLGELEETHKGKSMR